MSAVLSKYVKVNDSKGLKSVLKITKEATNLKKIEQKYDIYNYKDLNYAKLRNFANYSLVNVRRVCRVIDYSNAAKYLEYFNHGQVRETFPSSIMKREIFMNEHKGKEILETVIKSQKEILDYIEKVLEENNLSIAYHFYRILVGKALIDRNKHPYCRFANDSVLELEKKYGAKPIRGAEINKIIGDIRKDLKQIKMIAEDNEKRLPA
ncbi:MAG: hypothetical protein MUC49_21040 [Raineya sp.]|nr:hypothetical protein [Raineya sp.]